eukprot:2952229-Prymnesium_polylepis.1
METRAIATCVAWTTSTSWAATTATRVETGIAASRAGASQLRRVDLARARGSEESESERTLHTRLNLVFELPALHSPMGHVWGAELWVWLGCCGPRRAALRVRACALCLMPVCADGS